MTRNLVFALSIVAATGAAGCKDDRPTPMQFDPAKANYTKGQSEYTQGQPLPTPQGGRSGAVTP